MFKNLWNLLSWFPHVEEDANATGGRGGTGHPQCTYYKKMDHNQENCFSLNDFPTKIANISKAEAAEPKFSNEEYQRILEVEI